MIRYIKNPRPESPELCALQWFCKEICQHVVSRAVFHTEVFLVDVVGNEEVTNFKMSRSFAAGHLPIVFE